MKEKVKTVYYCEHCNKKGLSKFHMIQHEKWCAKNPANENACSGCSHFQDDTQEVVYDRYIAGGYDEITIKCKSYKCGFNGQKMHPLLAVKKDLPNRYPETFENSILFPKSCINRKSSF